jgi:hypothetical protein
LYDWLGDHDFLIVKADRCEPLVVVPLSFATELAAIAEHAKEFLREQESPPGRIPAQAVKQREQLKLAKE